MRPIKMLYILNIANRVNNFSYTSMMAAKELGIDYHIAGNWGYETDDERHADELKYGITIHQIEFIRSPFHPGNVKALCQLTELVRREQFDIIHCNTPIGGITGRMAAEKCHTPYVIYQAHGFHFYQGAPLLNWMLFYPIERFFAHRTDEMITINQEDYARAKQKMHLRHGGKIDFVPGVGIDLQEFSHAQLKRPQLLKEIAANNESLLLISVGELNQNKNYGVVISALEKAGDENIHYLICGEGSLKEELCHMTEKLGLASRVHFMGFRTDVREMLAAVDVFIMPSFREGLSRSLMEAMASGLPCIVSRIRGNVDLLSDQKGGFLCSPSKADSFAEAIKKEQDSHIRAEQGKYNLNAVRRYANEVVTAKLKTIYQEAILSEQKG